MLTQPQLASTAEPELGTAQPQLVYYIITIISRLKGKTERLKGNNDE
jgi:hypothetical protein